MIPHGWRNIDQTHLLHKIVLLQLLNRIPKKPSETDLSEWKAREDGSTPRVLNIRREKEVAESFAFLAATTNDPRKVVAACVEESEAEGCLTVRLAINKGDLASTMTGFKRMATILERVARTGELGVHCQLAHL